jgi:curved DNA-binding protein
MTDAYQTLGVQRNATEAEIKKAYRKLAGQHHPDKGGDTAKFQEIQSAYETLSDPVKRQQHDNPNPFGGQGGNGFEFHFNQSMDPHDIFSQFFGQRGGNPFHQQRQPRRNKDLRINLVVDLSSTLNDQSKTVSVQTTKGDRFNVDVKIPRGVTNGTTIKYTQMGDNLFESLTRGDLYVIITVTASEKYQIHGINLVTTLKINCIEAMLGTEREVEGPDGKTFLVKVPAGCQHQARFGLQGQGLYQMNSSVRGDLIVNIEIAIVTPNPQQAEQLRAIWNL